MGSQEPPKIPVVDFSKESLNPGTSAWISACNDVRCALEEYGCFVVVYDKVSSDLHNKFFRALEELFDLPLETRKRNTSAKPFHGFLGQFPFIPLYEATGIENPTTLEGIQSFTNLMWPNGNDCFCESVHSYSKLVGELDLMVTRMVFESYGVLKYYDIESMTYLLRLTKYREPLINETNVGFGPHTDKSFMAILNQNQINGLEIETKDGEWIGFDELSPSSFAVIAGDALMAWSNGRIHSVNHRVIMNQNKERYSLGFFSFNKGVIQIPQELVDEEHPLQYKPLDHTGLLHFFATEEGRKAGCAVKAYCGV